MQIEALNAAGEVLKEEGIIKSDDVGKVVDELINPDFSTEVIQ